MDERVRILCVDDERNVLRALERVFMDDDYEILTAGSGEEGLALLEEAEVQVILSDYRMPIMSGVEFLREVYRRWPDTVRIVLSGYADTVAVVSAINEGHIYKFVAKPWSDDELRATVEDALERYFLKKRNRELVAELRVKNEELERINSDLKSLVQERDAAFAGRHRLPVTGEKLLDALPVGVIVLDPDRTVFQANEAGCRILALAGKHFVGQEAGALLPEELSRFVDASVRRGSAWGTVRLGGTELVVRGAGIGRAGREGVILTLVEREEP